MDENQKPIVDPAYTVEKFDGEILLYTETRTQAVYLNDAAYAVWELCKEDLTVGEIVDYLKKLYPNQKAQIQDDVFGALQTLEENSVIRLSNVG
ncbi:MAG: hypothetical protein ACI8ZB_004898 [Desulforhopalus sp.]|jgi:hypothetical protein